jgi:hypothetical protein
VGSGCAYTSYSYRLYFDAETGRPWALVGELERHHGEQQAENPYRHWPAHASDRYRLVLRPVTRNSNMWERGKVSIEDLTVATPLDTVRLKVEEVVDLRSGPAVPPEGQRVEFLSDFFRLRVPPPDELDVDCVLKIVDPDTGEDLGSWKLHGVADVQKHRVNSFKQLVEGV